MGAAVELHLKRYFNLHGESLPPPGLYGRVLREVELPLIALAACFASGDTVIRDAAELRVKESDRISSTARELRRLGAAIEELPDGLRIRPVRRLQGAAVSTHGDHRLAIMLALAGVLARGATVVRNAGVVAVSYPWFWRDLDLLSGRRAAAAKG